MQRDTRPFVQPQQHPASFPRVQQFQQKQQQQPIMAPYYAQQVCGIFFFE
jgi:hypothetical protein